MDIKEAHSTTGRARSFDSEFKGRVVSFWSHLSRRKAGIGIVVSVSLLAQFDGLIEWEEVCPGRIGILHLRGRYGLRVQDDPIHHLH